MKGNQAEFSVLRMCQTLEVSTSGYYGWRDWEPSSRRRGDERLTERIRRIHEGSRSTYGSPRVHAELVAHGERISRKRVARLMKAAGLEGVSRRKGVRTTVRCPQACPAPDLVERDFEIPGPDQLWVAHITYIPTWAGFLYLAVVLDAWCRKVVGWAMGTSLHTQIVLDALDMAICQRRPQAVVHHSDHGSQYTSIAFGKRCRWSAPISTRHFLES